MKTIIYIFLLLTLTFSCRVKIVDKQAAKENYDSLKQELVIKNSKIDSLKKEIKKLQLDEGKYTDDSEYKKGDCVRIWNKWTGVIAGAYISKEDNKTVYYRINVLTEAGGFIEEYYYGSELETSKCE